MKIIKGRAEINKTKKTSNAKIKIKSWFFRSFLLVQWLKLSTLTRKFRFKFLNSGTNILQATAQLKQQ